jgi:hypothetical protein
MIALDLSRLLSRAGFATPTGIDRVELAYARHLLASGKEHCFAAINAVGAIAALPEEGAARFVEMLEAMWRGGATPEEAQEINALAWRLRRAALSATRALRTRLRADPDPVYLLVSHETVVVLLGFLGRVSGSLAIGSQCNQRSAAQIRACGSPIRNNPETFAVTRSAHSDRRCTNRRRRRHVDRAA